MQSVSQKMRMSLLQVSLRWGILFQCSLDPRASAPMCYIQLLGERLPKWHCESSEGKGFLNWKCYSSALMGKVSAMQVLKLWRERYSCSWVARNTRVTPHSKPQPRVLFGGKIKEGVCFCLGSSRELTRSQGLVFHGGGTFHVEISKVRITVMASPSCVYLFWVFISI